MPAGPKPAKSSGPQPQAVLHRPGDEAPDHRGVHQRVLDHALLAHLLAPSLELRLEQHHQVAPGFSERQTAGITFSTPMNDRSKTARSQGSGSGARSRALVRSMTTTRSSCRRR